MRLSPTADLSGSDRDALSALSSAVYPPEEWSDWPGKSLEWAEPQWCVRIWDDAGALVSYVGVLLRNITLDEVPLRVGGVGGIKTHPASRGRGYARVGVGKALEFFNDRQAAFALLVCESDLVRYYASLGWNEFEGRLLVTQRGKITEFTFNRVMTHAVRASAPVSGVISLGGPPW